MLHDRRIALINISNNTLVLTQVCSRLLNKVAGLVETYKVSFRVFDCFPNRPVVGLASVGVLGGAFEPSNSFLLEVWH